MSIAIDRKIAGNSLILAIVFIRQAMCRSISAGGKPAFRLRINRPVCAIVNHEQSVYAAS